MMVRFGEFGRFDKPSVFSLAAAGVAPDFACRAVTQRRFLRVIGVIQDVADDTFGFSLFADILMQSSEKKTS